MLTNRARLFQRTCLLIAKDRAAHGRDASHHLWLASQIDECARAILCSMKEIGRVIDAHLKG